MIWRDGLEHHRCGWIWRTNSCLNRSSMAEKWISFWLRFAHLIFRWENRRESEGEATSFGEMAERGSASAGADLHQDWPAVLYSGGHSTAGVCWWVGWAAGWHSPATTHATCSQLHLGCPPFERLSCALSMSSISTPACRIYEFCGSVQIKFILSCVWIGCFGCSWAVGGHFASVRRGVHFIATSTKS